MRRNTLDFLKDFTLNSYRELLILAKSTHKFCLYDNFSKDENFILWRHDVDFSMHDALKLSEIEKQEGVQATYFVNMHSEFYNLFEKEIADLVHSILKNNHTLGLHFDCHYYGNLTEKELVDRLKTEKSIISDHFGTDVNVFSFHNPTDQILVFDDFQYAGMINTYARYFRNEVVYTSDSNGYWRHDPIRKVLEDNSQAPIQVLTHPAWWQETEMTPKEKIWKCIDGRAKNTKMTYRDFLKSFGRELLG